MIFHIIAVDIVAFNDNSFTFEAFQILLYIEKLTECAVIFSENGTPKSEQLDKILIPKSKIGE